MDVSKFYNNKELSDIILYDSNDKYYAHRIVLNESFLLKIFETEMKKLPSIKLYLMMLYGINNVEINDLVNAWKNRELLNSYIKEERYNKFLLNVASSIYTTATPEDQYRLLFIHDHSLEYLHYTKIDTLKLITRKEIENIFRQEEPIFGVALKFLVTWIYFNTSPYLLSPSVSSSEEEETKETLLFNVKIKTISTLMEMIDLKADPSDLPFLASFYSVNNVAFLQKSLELISETYKHKKGKVVYIDQLSSFYSLVDGNEVEEIEEVEPPALTSKSGAMEPMIKPEEVKDLLRSIFKM